MQSIKEMVAEQLVVEESAEQFAFRHALTRETIYATLLERERMAIHGRIAETMRGYTLTAADNRSRELSYHHLRRAIGRPRWAMRGLPAIWLRVSMLLLRRGSTTDERGRAPSC